MTIPDELDYDRAAERISRIIAGLGILGTAVFLVVKGWPWGCGFFLGSLIAGVNFRWLRRLVDSLGGARPKRRRKSVYLALRYVLLGAAAYAIVRVSSVSLPAVFAGVFVLTAAIMIEAVVEIAYARK